MTFNYHTHTQRCHHATGTDREYIEAAIRAGIKTLGFSDHSPYFFEGDYYSNFRMCPDVAYEYFDTLNNLKEEYKDRIDIKIGFETEYYPDYFDKVLELYKNFNVDYLILGQHFLDNEKKAHYSGSPTQEEYHLEKYVNQVICAIQTGKYTYIAHPDLLNFQGDIKIYRKHFFRLCQEALKLNIPMEINFLGLADNRAYPNERFWEIVGEVGNLVVLGADAHYPGALNDSETEYKAMKICEKYKLKLLNDIKLNPV